MGQRACRSPRLRRPLRVTVISWFAVAWGLFTLGPKLFALADAEAYQNLQETMRTLSLHAIVPLPFLFHVAYSFLASLVLVLSGCFMLRGRPWARALFLAWCASSLLITLVTYGFAAVLFVRVGTFLLFFLLLVWGSSSQFFSHRRGQAD